MKQRTISSTAAKSLTILSRWAIKLVAATVIVAASGNIAHAQKGSFIAGREVWPGRRLVMLLPLQLSDNWNADVRWGQTLLKPSEAQLRKALENTGKFSVVQPYRFDPILQRALLDKRIAKDQIDELVNNPSLQSASSVLANLGFDLTPVIADFRLEEVRSSGPEKAPTIQVQVLGKLYPLNSQEADQTKVFTSDPERYRISQFDTVINAATNSFQMIANEFVRPVTEAVLPRVEPAPSIEKVDPKDKKGKNKNAAKGGKNTPSASTNPVTPATPTTPAPETPNAPSTTPVTPPLPNAAGSSSSATAKAPATPTAGAPNTTESPAIFINPLERGQLTRNP